MKLIIMQPSISSCHSLLIEQIFSFTTCFQTPLAYGLYLMCETKFHTQTEAEANYTVV
jgi:hypothetical protein